MTDLWARIAHAWGLCRWVHLGNHEPGAVDCHACRKRVCSVCAKAAP